jgi:hypothetical protein
MTAKKRAILEAWAARSKLGTWAVHDNVNRLLDVWGLANCVNWLDNATVWKMNCIRWEYLLLKAVQNLRSVEQVNYKLLALSYKDTQPTVLTLRLTVGNCKGNCWVWYGWRQWKWQFMMHLAAGFVCSRENDRGNSWPSWHRSLTVGKVLGVARNNPHLFLQTQMHRRDCGIALTYFLSYLICSANLNKKQTVSCVLKYFKF